jgi:secreted Zn-dependent insulinase-like peptidase
MARFNSEQLDDLLSHLKDLWDEAKDKLGDYSEELEKIKDEVKPEWDKAKQEMKEYYQKAKADFLKKISVTSKDNMTVYEVDTLTSREMLQYAKNHIVKGANMVVAFKQQGIINDKKVAFVYLSYGKGRELLADENNHYVIIKAKQLEQDVLNLFIESDLVILT